MAKKTRILFALLLVLVMVFTAACSAEDSSSDKDDKKPNKGGSSLSDIFGKDDKDNENETTAPSMAIQTEPTEAETEPTEAETEPTEAETEPTEAETEPVEDEELPENPGQIVGTVLYNKNGIKITVDSYETDSFYGPEIGVTIDNTSDKDVLVFTDLLSVNGCMMSDVMLYAEAEAGSKVEDFFMFSNETMKQYGITEISEVQFYITISDPETYQPLDTSKLKSLKLTESYTLTIDYSGAELYNKDGVRFICKGVGSDDLFDGMVYFFAENNTDKNISFYAQNVTVNGIETEDTFWIDTRSGTVVLDTMILWDLDALRLASVDQIETITMDLYLIDYDTWDDIDGIAGATITIQK